MRIDVLVAVTLMGAGSGFPHEAMSQTPLATRPVSSSGEVKQDNAWAALVQRVRREGEETVLVRQMSQSLGLLPDHATEHLPVKLLWMLNDQLSRGFSVSNLHQDIVLVWFRVDDELTVYLTDLTGTLLKARYWKKGYPIVHLDLGEHQQQRFEDEKRFWLERYPTNPPGIR